MNNRFDILATPISGLRIVQRKPIVDKRGYLERLFCKDELQSVVSDKPFVQINHTLTEGRGIVRGMHFQYPPYADTRFVSCLTGEVFDVAVDLRNNSPTFLQWHAEILSAGNHRTFVIPEGFAHGIHSLSETCEMLYFHTAPYNPEAEGGLNVNDPRLGIAWPLPVTGLSDRDAGHPLLKDTFSGITP